MGKTTRINLTGLRFNRILVLQEIPERNKNNHILYLCKCDCGTIKEILGSSLRSGSTQSCGCLQKEKATTHGMENTLIYKTYQSMHDRCYNPNNPRYINWGGRGITVCDRWHSFENFYIDMGDKPKGMSIERINNNKEYSPENCIWASSKQQANNRRNSIKIQDGDKIYNIENYAKLIGLSESGTRKRVYKTMRKINGVFVKEA
jgi:hypothetical protein